MNTLKDAIKELPCDYPMGKPPYWYKRSDLSTMLNGNGTLTIFYTAFDSNEGEYLEHKIFMGYSVREACKKLLDELNYKPENIAALQKLNRRKTHERNARHAGRRSNV